MAGNKQEQYKSELDIFQLRHESGLQTMRTWLFAKRDKLNVQWIDSVGDELLRLQGEAKLVQKQIRMIDEGPTNKETAK